MVLNIEKNIILHNISYDILNIILYGLDNHPYKFSDILLFIYDC